MAFGGREEINLGVEESSVLWEDWEFLGRKLCEMHVWILYGDGGFYLALEDVERS